MKYRKVADGDNLPMRNSMAEFLMFAKEAGAALRDVDVRFSQKLDNSTVLGRTC